MTMYMQDILNHTLSVLDVSSKRDQRDPRAAAIPEPTEKLRDRFLSFVIERESGCHEWTGCTSEGYGTFSIEGRTYRSHRVAYRYFVSVIPDGLLVLHKCDNRLCVNPDHLSVGTALDNTRDMIAKGRDKFSPPPGPPKEFCINGHRYSEVGQYKDGACAQCSRDATHAYYMRKKDSQQLRNRSSFAPVEEPSPCADTGTAGVSDLEYDPTPWCSYCRARTADKCNCGPIASNE